MFDRLIADLRVTMLAEPVDLGGLFKNNSAIRQVAPKKWADSYLAAFALAANATLVTFDHGFAQYPISATILE